MADFKLMLIGANYAIDVTTALTGINMNLPPDERVEMANWPKNKVTWEAIDKALEKKYQGGNDNADNR